MNQVPPDFTSSVFKINTSTGTGTGFFLKTKNIFVTNFHVIQGDREVAIEDRNKHRYLAKVVFVNPDVDLAFLQPSRQLTSPAAGFDSFANVQSRERVFVLGFPFGMPYTETEGIVSSPKQLMDGRYYIQTDAAVNPGNSGGPVVNSRGELVGITTSKFTEADNVGFAIPVESLSEDLESFNLNKELKYSVKCGSCKSLIFEKTEYCDNCGSNIDNQVFDQVSPTVIAAFVEDALTLMGLNPVLARGGQDYWTFHHGTALITIYFENREYLYAMSPINDLPTANLEKLYKYLLKMPLPTYKLGVLDNKIFITYRLHMSDIFSIYAEKIKSNLAIFPLKADEMSRFFKDYFGCKMTNYSREEAAKEDKGDAGGTAASYTDRADSLHKLGRWKEALEFYQKAEKIYEDLGDRPGVARSCTKQGYVLEKREKWDEAMALHKKAENIYQELGDRNNVANCHIYRSWVLVCKGEYNEALNLQKQVEKTFEQLGDRGGVVLSYRYQAIAYLLANKIQEWDSMNSRTERMLKQMGDQFGLARFYRSQADDLRSFGFWEGALDMHKKELRTYFELQNREGQAISFAAQAKILIDLAQMHDAMALLKKSEKIFAELDSRAELADNYNDQALVLFHWNRFEESANLRNKAEKIYEELDDSRELALSLGEHGLILRKWGRLQEAFQFMERAEKTFVELGDHLALAATYGNKALVLAQMKRLDEALALHQKEEKICLELENKKGLARTWWNQGCIYEEKKDYAKQVAAWEKSIAVNKSLKIPTEQDEAKVEYIKKHLLKT